MGSYRTSKIYSGLEIINPIEHIEMVIIIISQTRNTDFKLIINDTDWKSNNFEYNLNFKIKNKNFDINIKEPVLFTPWKIFIPATGVIVASILLFFTIFNESDSFENPFQIKPQLRNELSNNLLNSSKTFGDFGSKNKINKNDVVLKEEIPELDSDVLPERVAENKKDIAETEKNIADFPFDESNSTNLDDLLKTKRNASKIDRRATLAGRSKSPSSFNGFYIREEVDKKYVEALKAKYDSLKKAMKEVKRN